MQFRDYVQMAAHRPVVVGDRNAESRAFARVISGFDDVLDASSLDELREKLASRGGLTPRLHRLTNRFWDNYCRHKRRLASK